MLYTPLSYDDIHAYQQNYDKYEMVTYQNRQVFIEKMESGEKQIIQLLSTDPNDYLNESFTPGRIISN